MHLKTRWKVGSSRTMAYVWKNIPEDRELLLGATYMGGGHVDEVGTVKRNHLGHGFRFQIKEKGEHGIIPE